MKLGSKGYTHRDQKTTFCAGVGDELSTNIPNAPDEAGADDLGLYRVMSQAVLIPLPQPRHQIRAR